MQNSAFMITESQREPLAPLYDIQTEDKNGCFVEPSWLLRCVAGPYRGRFTFIRGSETIGSSRDSDEVSFSVKGNGVEDVHCRVSLKEDGYMLENLSQSSGTWIKLRWDAWTRLCAGDKLLLDGRLVEVEEAGAGATTLTFDGIENEGDLTIRSGVGKQLDVKLSSESVEAFYRVASPVVLRPNDVIRIGLLRFEVHRFNYASASVQGIRPSMEDEDFCRDGLIVGQEECVSMFNVYDGHGGFDASRFLRNRFHRIFSDNFDSEKSLKSILATFQKCDEELLHLVQSKGLSTGVGSVVNSVLIDRKGRFICANLGDCRAILAMNDGSLVELSRDLKPLLPDETERIKRCGGFVSSANRVNGRLAVSRAIGDFEYKANLVESGKNCETMVSNVPEVRCHVGTGKESFLLIACDGLYDVISSRDVVSFINDRIASFVARNQEPDPSQICVDLVTECVIKRGTGDNVTIILVILHPFLSIN